MRLFTNLHSRLKESIFEPICNLSEGLASPVFMSDQFLEKVQCVLGCILIVALDNLGKFCCF